jgi:hypothetical protein
MACNDKHLMPNEMDFLICIIFYMYYEMHKLIALQLLSSNLKVLLQTNYSVMLRVSQ